MHTMLHVAGLWMPKSDIGAQMDIKHIDQQQKQKHTYTNVMGTRILEEASLYELKNLKSSYKDIITSSHCRGRRTLLQ